jgi:hypothetical protein
VGLLSGCFGARRTSAMGPKPKFAMLESGQRDMHATAFAGDLRQALRQQPKQRRCSRCTLGCESVAVASAFT